MTVTARGTAAGTNGGGGGRRRRPRPPWSFPAPGWAAAAVVASVLTAGPALVAGPSGARTAVAAEAAPLAPGDLIVTLTGLDDGGAGGPCRASLRIDNRSAVVISTFSLRLVLFDRSGAVLRQLSVLAMPVTPGRPTEATFPASMGPCRTVEAIRLIDFPLCADADGRRLGCARAARVRGAGDVPFE